MSKFIRITAATITPELKKTHYIRLNRNKQGIVTSTYAIPKETMYTAVTVRKTKKKTGTWHTEAFKQRADDIRLVKETFRMILKDKSKLETLKSALLALA